VVSSVTALQRDRGSRGPARAAFARFKGLSSPVFEARKNDISRNRHPKGVVTDEGDLDEDPDDCKPGEN